MIVKYKKECLDVIKRLGLNKSLIEETFNNRTRGMVTKSSPPQLYVSSWHENGKIIYANGLITKFKKESNRIQIQEVTSSLALELNEDLPAGSLDPEMTMEGILSVIANSFGLLFSLNKDSSPTRLYCGNWEGDTYSPKFELFEKPADGFYYITGSFNNNHTCHHVWAFSYEKYNEWFKNNSDYKMNKNRPGQIIFKDTTTMISEINELIHVNLDKKWMATEWKKCEDNISPVDIHPFVNVAYKAHQQINQFIKDDVFGMTPETFELVELAMKINLLKRNKVKGLQSRLDNLISFDFNLYLTARYEIQVAGMFLQRGHQVEFIEECKNKTPDILVTNPKGKCEVECKYKELHVDQLDYIKSIYNNTQTARKQFSKQYPGVICVEIGESRFDEFKAERTRLEKEIARAMRNSSSISAILLTSKIYLEEDNDYVYRHRVQGFPSAKPRYPLPDWLKNNLVDN
ncbi:MAG: hypothetical protein ACUZ8I_05920 [Candidatus Scalindua sp.]